MKSLLNILLFAGLFALCYAECEVCNCVDPPARMTEQYFNSAIKDADSQIAIRTYAPITSLKVVNCKVEIECTFPIAEDDEYSMPIKTLVTATRFSDTTTNLDGVTCNADSKWIDTDENEEVTYVGCFVNKEIEL